MPSRTSHPRQSLLAAAIAPLLLLAACHSSHSARDSRAQPIADPAPLPAHGATMKNDRAMQAAMAAMTPGEVHARLMRLAGDWDTVSRVEMAGQPSTESHGSCTIVAALDGRFLHESGSGESMGMAERHFKVWGYNNGSHRHEAVWSWTLATGLLHLSGEPRHGGGTIDWNAWYDNEAGARESFNVLTTLTDDDHFSHKLYGGRMPDGSPGPTVYITYTRRK